MTYDEFIQEWGNGIKQVTKYGGQCVSLVAEFEAENNRPIVWGEKGAVLWINNPIMLPVYDWIWNNPNDSNQVPARGDIVVWDEHTPYTDGSGHIAFFERPLDDQFFMSYGQNSGGATAHFAQVHWAHVAGWYHLKPQPEPAHQPYTKRTITPKRIVFNKDTHLYNLSLQTIEDIVRPDKWVGNVVADRNTPVWVDGIIDHQSGHSYYTHEEPFGYATEDCDDYVEPVPVTPAPPPAAPIPFTKAEDYTILPDAIVYFGSVRDAIIDQNALGQLDKGTYKVVSRDKNMINLSTKYPDNQDKWINPSMNVAAPKVEQAAPVTVIPAVETTPVVVAAPETPQVVWKPVYVPLRADHEPIVFKSVNAQDYPIIDYFTGRPTIYMPAYHTVKAVDRFTDSKGSVYYRSESMAAEGLGYGIPKALLQEAVFDTALSRAERLAMKSASFVDKAYYAWLKAEKNMKFLDGIKSVFAGINQGKRK